MLFTEGGDRDKPGRGWVWNDEAAECIHQNHIFRARLFLSEVEPRFVSLHGNTFGQESRSAGTLEARFLTSKQPKLQA